MRIWMINHYAAPPTMAGGTRHYNFAKQLIQRGHEVTLIAANYNHFSHTYIPTPAEPGQIDLSYDVPFMWLPTPTYHGNTLARLQNMLAFSWKVISKKYLPRAQAPDLILASSPHLFAALSGELLARQLNLPFILEIRDLWPESLVDLGRISKRHPLIMVMRGIERYLYKRAQRVISLLPAAEQYLVKNGVKSENILWLPNAVDTDSIPHDLSVLPSDKFTLMYAGAHGLANDLDTVLHAAQILQNEGIGHKLRIRLIGSGPEKDRLKALAAELKLFIVEFEDPVSKNEIYNKLKQADAFLMLLKESPVFRWGISPNKLFDYLLMGRPVIFGVNTPFNPIEKHQAGITVQPSNPKQLAAAIQQLVSLPQTELNKMGARGKEYVLQHHHLHRLTDSLENLMMKTTALASKPRSQ